MDGEAGMATGSGGYEGHGGPGHWLLSAVRAGASTAELQQLAGALLHAASRKNLEEQGIVNPTTNDFLDFVQAKIQDKEDIPAVQQRLINVDKPLESGRAVPDYHAHAHDESASHRAFEATDIEKHAFGAKANDSLDEVKARWADIVDDESTLHLAVEVKDFEKEVKDAHETSVGEAITCTGETNDIPDDVKARQKETMGKKVKVKKKKMGTKVAELVRAAEVNVGRNMQKELDGKQIVSNHQCQEESTFQNTLIVKAITVVNVTDDTLDDEKAEIQDKGGIPPVQQMDDGCPESDYHFQDMSTSHSAVQTLENAVGEKEVQNTLTRKPTLISEASSFIDDEKTKTQKEGIPPLQQRLTGAGRQMEDGCTLALSNNASVIRHTHQAWRHGWPQQAS